MQGDPIKPNTRATVPCIMDIPVKGSGKLILTQSLYSCTADEAPQRRSDEGGKSKTTFQTHATISNAHPVRKIGEMSIDLTKTAAELRKKAKSIKKEKSKPATKSIEIQIDFKITPHTDKGTLLVVALHGKKTIGEAQIQYEADPTWECRQLSMAKKSSKAKKAREQSQDETE